MDSLITAAARGLAAGDALGALNLIALRDDAPALALRGIAMAQLGDLPRATLLLRRAARAFGPREAVARARCTVAEAEVALVSRDLGRSARPLDAAGEVLERHGDRANGAHARYLAIRRLLLLGRLDDAEARVASFDASPLPAASRAAFDVTVAGIAIRRLRIGAARAALERAHEGSRALGIPALEAEVESAAGILGVPAARLVAQGTARPVGLDAIEALLASDWLVVDACRRVVCLAGRTVRLDTRPVLFALVRALAEACPGDVTRAALLARAFRARQADESHRARLRVEIGRLRKELRGLAGIRATKDGFVLVPRDGLAIAVLAPLSEEADGAVLALLGDGEAWSSSALALALGVSQRTAQRALDDLAADGRARPVGQGRARRWMAPPLPGFPSALLLPAMPHGG